MCHCQKTYAQAAELRPRNEHATIQAAVHEIKAFYLTSRAPALPVRSAAGGAAAIRLSAETRATPSRLLRGTAFGVPAAKRRCTRFSSTDGCPAGYRSYLQQTATDTCPNIVLDTCKLSCAEKLSFGTMLPPLTSRVFSQASVDRKSRLHSTEKQSGRPLANRVGARALQLPVLREGWRAPLGGPGLGCSHRQRVGVGPGDSVWPRVLTSAVHRCFQE